MSDIGDIDSPRAANVGGRPTDLQTSLETNGNRDTSTGCFATGLVSSTMQLKIGFGELGEVTQRDGKALRMRLSMVCKNDALDVVKTVTRKCGFESWRKLCKEYGSFTGTSLHECSNHLEYDFGTTDGFKKRWLKWENQIAVFQKATSEAFSDRLKCAIVLSGLEGPSRRICGFRIEEITELFEWH